MFLQLRPAFNSSQHDDISSFSVMTLDVQLLYTVPFITCFLKEPFPNRPNVFERFYIFHSQKLKNRSITASVAAADDRIEDDHIGHQLLLWGQ